MSGPNSDPRLAFLMASGVVLSALGCGGDAATPTGPGPDLALASNIWHTRANMPSDRLSPTAAVVPDAQKQTILYVIGGHDPNVTFCSGGVSTVQAYNPATDTWRRVAPLPRQLSHTNGTGVVKGKIYVSGGCFRYKGYSNWLLMYDPATNTWTRKRDMPMTSFDGVTGVIDDKLYVVTSCHGQEDCDYGDYGPYLFPDQRVFRYDPATDTWTDLGIPPLTPFREVAGTIGKKLYIAASPRTYVYDPATNIWTTGAGIGTYRVDAAGTALAGKLYVVGGTSRWPAGPDVATANVYDPATDSWHRIAPMPAARCCMAAGRVVVNGTPRLEVVGNARPGNNVQYIP